GEVHLESPIRQEGLGPLSPLHQRDTVRRIEELFVPNGDQLFLGILESVNVEVIQCHVAVILSGQGERWTHYFLGVTAERCRHSLGKERLAGAQVTLKT